MGTQNDGLRLEVRPTIRARSPRELLIFSLDDTLIDTTLYWLARAAFARAVAAKTGMADGDIAGAFEARNAENERIEDFCPVGDAAMMHDTWDAFQKGCGIPQDNDSGLYLLMAQSLRGKFPSEIPGAEDLLKWAQPRFTLALLASGGTELQQRKLEASNLGSYFKAVKVVPSKGTEDFRAVISEMGFSPRNSWVIGGSIHSDINPGIAAGANCIHYTHPHTTYTGTRQRVEEPAQPIFRIHDLDDARAILAKTSTCVAA